ncbi:hypothetical protein [Chelativorans sp. AA-79]|uniref:hypothetical protein n=1 Tax=Chelativorans sp. AA-79 TaxID=3028735 RepID=UPI0023FA2C6B|nr:hypothetical protein [Chelativorans sp. AA-79]WEX10306.1 hypothetical protein PVE73_04930 [Chelativorans sp. AA-79]
MALIGIRAFVSCDGCNTKMTFDLDAADERPRDWSWYDLVVDHARGFGPREGGFSSVQGESDKVLCPACTKTVDDFVTEDRNATDAEITEALEQELFPNG